MLFLLLACAEPIEPANYLSVLTINPSHGAVNVPVDADLRVIFSAGLDNPSTGQVTLSTTDGTPVPTALRWFEDSSTVLLIDPIEDLATNTDFVLTLGSGLDSEVGVLSSEVVSSFSTGSQSEGDSDTDTDADSDSDSDSDADSDTDADSDSDSDADSDVTFAPAGIGLTVLASWDGENLVRWADVDGNFQPAYAQFTFYEEEYFEGGDERYTCVWSGSIQVQGDAAIDVEAYESLEVRFSDLGTGTCSGFPLTWGEARNPAAVLSGQSFGLAFTPMSAEFEESFRSQVEAADLDWESDWQPYAFSTQLSVLGSSNPNWIEMSYAVAVDLDDDGAVSDNSSLIPLEQGIENELIYAQPWFLASAETFTD